MNSAAELAKAAAFDDKPFELRGWTYVHDELWELRRGCFDLAGVETRGDEQIGPLG